MSNHKIYAFLLLLTVAICHGSPTDEQSTVNYFCNGQEATSDVVGPPSSHQGLPGKRGAPGVPGQKGDPGKVDEDFVVQIVENHLKKLLQPITSNNEFPKTCAEIVGENRTSGYYIISPEPSKYNPIAVYCRFEESRAYTVLRHDSEEEKRTDNCEDKKCYVRDINYDNKIEIIRSIVDNSQNCRQRVKYRCHGSVLNDGFAAWTSFYGNDVNWTDQTFGVTCPCSTNKSCVNPKNVCNCDNNGAVWTSDEGYITDKEVLPVTKLKFGDNGDASEIGFHTLDALECY